MAELLLGQTLGFEGNPMIEGTAAARHRTRGGVLIEDGRIAAVGEADDLRRAHPRAWVTEYGDALISAGFVDAHAHYPQTAMIASWGKRLIDWLQSYTFPEEMKFGDPAYAAEIAGRYFDLTLANGTTTVCSYCTIHPESVDAFFAEAERRGLRAFAGKTCMDRDTAPPDLRDTATTAYDDSKRLLERWHGKARLSYVITPRFSPTSTPEQLEALGSLWRDHPDCLMQTHLSEQHDEIAWVHDLFPEDPDYYGVYERFGMTGPRSIMGHAIHLTAREKTALAASGTGVAHCPTSNAYIGSGLCDVAGLKAAGVPVGLATDTGGGSSFSMLVTMRAAYEVAQLRGASLHPAQLLWLATAGSAEVMGMGDKIGRLVPGMEADVIALDLRATPALQAREARDDDPWHGLFGAMILGDERCVIGTWSGGRRLR